MVRNKMEDLNNILFEQLERLNDDSLNLDEELKRTKAISNVSDKLIQSADLSYRVMKLRADITGDIETPDVLESKHVKKIESSRRKNV
ncbi:hypothetical protein FYL30_06100 [Lactobacillus salivarius]|uniref:hypothetical protein n=1 Tax=Ligilactobacillus salivarius TaxID=1624 RepID=UPI00136A8F9D|nr:hypothetical protein [Ligilactobacillus salivarius]MYY88822.1 hypothetical protein [Ligilactobacillus salivarius]